MTSHSLTLKVDRFIQTLLIYDVLRFSARKAVEVGVDGIVVSNHGGRQLDYSPPTISVLEEVLILIHHAC